MSELSTGQVWTVGGTDVEVIQANDMGEVEVEWPDGSQTWEGQTWLTAAGELA